MGASYRHNGIKELFTAEELQNLPDGEYTIEEFVTITIEGTTVVKETKYKVQKV